MSNMHLIHFPDREQRKRAVRVFLDVPATRLVLPDSKMVVTDAHIQALEREKVGFNFISSPLDNGERTASLQS